jgi:hypothetical protein
MLLFLHPNFIPFFLMELRSLMGAKVILYGGSQTLVQALLEEWWGGIVIILRMLAI